AHVAHFGTEGKSGHFGGRMVLFCFLRRRLAAPGKGIRSLWWVAKPAAGLGWDRFFTAALAQSSHTLVLNQHLKGHAVCLHSWIYRATTLRTPSCGMRWFQTPSSNGPRNQSRRSPNVLTRHSTRQSGWTTSVITGWKIVAE